MYIYTIYNMRWYLMGVAKHLSKYDQIYQLCLTDSVYKPIVQTQAIEEKIHVIRFFSRTMHLVRHERLLDLGCSSNNPYQSEKICKALSAKMASNPSHQPRGQAPA